MKKQNMKRILSLSMLIMAVMLFLLLIQPLSMLAVALDEDSHTHDEIAFTEWTSTNSLPSSEGNYYLSADVTISSTWNVPSGTTNLCLNGHGIKMTGNGSVVCIEGGATLNLYDCDTATEHKFTVSDPAANGAGLAVVNDAATGEGVKTFTGGYITGGNAQPYGGGVRVDQYGKFDMYGGTIIGNKASSHGGGVSASGAGLGASNTKNFVMSGGAICYNTAGWGGGVGIYGEAYISGNGAIFKNIASAGGAGIELESAGKLYLEGGSITENLLSGQNGGMWKGAGVHFPGGAELHIKGAPQVTNNYQSDGTTPSNVFVRSGLKMTVDDALAEDAKIGVAMQNVTGTFTSGWNTAMGNADPSTYFKSDNGDYGVLLKDNEAQIGEKPHQHGNIIFTKWTSTNSLPTTAGNYYLAADVTISSTWEVPSGTTNLCLNGHGIKMTGNGSAVKVGEGRTLKLYDCDTTTEHRYSVSSPASNGAGVATVNDSLTSGYQTFTGGYITGGYLTGGYQYGAGINLEGNGATLYMYGGTIIGNRLTAGSTGGGGVCVQDWDKSGGFYMYGGSIIGNTSNYGGGVYVRTGRMELIGGTISKNIANGNIGGGVLVFGGGSTLVVQGGAISNNTAVHGGAVEASGDGTVTISGGSFTNNIATGKGGALTNQRTDGDTSPATFNISGAPVFSGNTAGGSANDFYLCNTAVLNLTAAMTNTTKIGITKASSTGVFTSGWSTHMKGKDPADYFVSDGGYEIVLIGNEVNVHQHNYGSLIEQVDSTCETDGMMAHYYCAECGQYFDENKERVSQDDLIIPAGHAYVHCNRVEPTCTEYGKREHFYCTECGLYFNTNKQQVAEWSLNIGSLGHDYDFDNAVFTWTPDDSAYYKWTATVSYSCKRCGDLVEKSAGIEGKSATWNQDNGIRAYVYYNSKYYYSEPIYRDSDAGTATMNSWTPWEYDDRLPDAKPDDPNSKGWYLTKDVTLTDTWTVPKTSYPYLKLCLNGHVITGNFDTPKTVIYVPKGVEFELCEYNFDETHYYYIGKTVTDSHGNELNFVGQIVSGEDDPNYIAAARKGSFKGGYVTGGTGRSIGGNTYGGAVYIDGDTGTKYYNCGQFTSTGVTFFGNYADYGGAVYVASNAYFDFSSGNIIGNQAGSEGGGVYANKRAYSDNQYGNYGMQSFSGQIVHNTAGQGGVGYGGGIAGWAYLPYGSIAVRGNAAVGENAKGGGVYGFLKVMDSHIYGNYTTGIGPGLYATNYNFTVDNSTSHICIYNNQYASSITVNEIALTSRRGDIYFASGYTLQLIGTSYPPSITDGVRVYVEMASGTGNFATNWKSSSSYKVYEFFAANPGYKIVENGSTLSLQSSGGNINVDISKPFVAYTSYYYANNNPASFTSDETHRYVFSGTQSVSNTFGISGYLKGDNSIYLRFDNLKLTASGTNSLFQFYPYYGDLDVYIELVGDSVLTTNGKPAFYGGRADKNLNVYFTGSGTLTVIDTVAGTANNLFGPYNDYNTHIYLDGEDITVYELVKEKIANIGFVTYSQEIKERITAARNGYDSLDDELKVKVTNYPDLLAAEAAYELAAAAEINLTATGYTGDYDGEAHGITVTVISPEGTTVKYGTKLGEYTLDESPTFTDAGTYTVYYQVTKEKCNTVSDFAIVKINKINATVTINGNNSAVDYDGTEHTITGYVATASTALYDVTNSFTFSGDATASQTSAGTTNMGLDADQFENTNPNFATVTFTVTDGYQTINKINATVNIVGNNSAVDYDGTEHTITGYVATASTALYDVTKDFTFNGEATASRTNAGTTEMGLAAEQFANVNENFATVTFIVTDGYQTINKINATVTIVGNTGAIDYDGTEHTVTGYVATTSTALYNVSNDFTFSGNATAKRTNAGTTQMGLAADQFANINENFNVVTFLVTDGFQTINKINATVTITGHTSTVDYDGNVHDVKGYDAVASTTLYDVANDFTFSGNATAPRISAGTRYMKLNETQFANVNENFNIVTFLVTDGYQTVSKINATVTIIGNNSVVDYDGTEHTVTGYVATADTDLYDVTKDFDFSGHATASQTNAGTTGMGLVAGQFANTNENFETVTFIVTDGYQTVNKINATVTIVGNNSVVDYDGAEHTVTGYVATADTDLYDVTKDFDFSGHATASQTNVGTTEMGLAAGQFANTNENFEIVTFIVTDGSQKVLPVNAVIVTYPRINELTYNGSEQELIVAGVAEGGTIYYALSENSVTVPDESGYQLTVPTAKEVGSYYVWYKIEADDNHNDFAPACLKVILAEDDWEILKGVVYQGDGSTPISGAFISLVSGNQIVDTTFTDDTGSYRFNVRKGIYNIVAEFEDVTKTILITLFEKAEQDIVMPDGMTESKLEVNSESEEHFGVAVGGLDEEAFAIRESENVPADKKVSVVMTVEEKTEEAAVNADPIVEKAQGKSLEFFEIKVEKTIGNITTEMEETSSILEIAIPYSKTSRKGLVVYSYHGNEVVTFTESDSKAVGTFRVDKENGYIYIYTNRFSTYAIGYTPYYRISGSLSLGSFTGTVTVTLTNKGDGTVYTLENVAMGNLSYNDIPSGEYVMTVTWTDGVKNTISLPVSVGGKAGKTEGLGGDAAADLSQKDVVENSVPLTNRVKTINDSTGELAFSGLTVMAVATKKEYDLAWEKPEEVAMLPKRSKE